VLAVLAALIAPAGAGAARVDWSTYGYSVARTGLNPHERALGPAQARTLGLVWSTDLGGVIEAQPVVAFDVQVPGDEADLAYVGTEAGRFVAVDTTTGAVRWSRDLGATHVEDCGATKGVTSTAVVDRARKSVYVVGGTGFVYDLDLGTGAIRRSWRITPNPEHEQVWSALTLMRGRLYVPVAGVCDLPPYHGRVVAIDTATGERAATWYVTSRHGPDGGGIWAWGGVSADPRRNALFTATGNSLPSPDEAEGYAEQVVRLNGDLKVRGSNDPGARGFDADFGATPLLYRVPGCPRQLAVGNKYGEFFVYDRAHIGRGPVRHISLGGSDIGTRALLGVAAFWKERRLVYVSNPLRRGVYRKGILAFRVAKGCRLSLAWHAKGPGNLTSSPSLAAGVLYYATGHDGHLVALNARTGRRLWSSGTTIGGHMYNAPALAGDAVYIGAFDGRLYKFAAAPAGQRSGANR
jgi:outer membrane protein assembly factor BamB